MADESYVDDPFFGFDLNSLHAAVSPTMPEYERMFYSGSQQASGQDTGEFQETPAPDSPQAMGADIRSIYLQLKGEQPGVADDLADHWANVWRMLLQTQTQLRNQTTAMAEGWESPHAKKIFLNQVGRMLAYLEVWMDAANTNSTTLRGLAIVMREAWEKMEKLWARWVNAVGASVSQEELAGKFQGGNYQMNEDRKAGAFGDDYRTFEENLKAYSKEAAILASETANKYAPLLANLEGARAVMLTPLNGRLHPAALGQDVPDLGGPGGLPPGGPGAPPPGAPPKPPPFDKDKLPPLDKDKLPPLDKDKLPDPDELKKKFDDKLPNPDDLSKVPEQLGSGGPGGLPQLPPLTLPTGLQQQLRPGPLPQPPPNTLRNGPALPPGAPSLLNTSSTNDLTALTNMTAEGVPVAGAPDPNALSNSLFPPGTITPPPGGMPNPPQQGKVIGGKGKPGVPGSSLGAPPPGSTLGNPQQQMKSGPAATPQAGEVPAAFQVPPAATPPVLGERKDARRRTPPPGMAARGTSGLAGTPPVLANPRLAGQAKPKPLPPRLPTAAKPASELAVDVPTGTAPVLDARPAQPVSAGPAADVPAALLGRKPTPSTPDRKARPEFHADRKARVPKKADPTGTETPATPTNAWEVETPGGPVVAGGGPQAAR